MASGEAAPNVYAKGPGSLPLPENVAYGSGDGVINGVPAGGGCGNTVGNLSTADVPLSHAMGPGGPGGYPFLAQAQGGMGYQQPMAGHGVAGYAQPPSAAAAPGYAVAVQQSVAQMQAVSTEREWTGGLCDCCHNGGDLDGAALCCLTFWCPCVTFGQKTEKAGLGGCVPIALLYVLACAGLCILLEIIAFPVSGSSPGGGALLWVLGPCTVPIALGIFAGYHRCLIRKKYGMRGDDCQDFALHACCHECLLCQEYRTMAINVTGGRWTGPAVKAVPLGQVVIPPAAQLVVQPGGQMFTPPNPQAMGCQ